MASKLGFYDLMNIAEQNAEQTARTTKKLKFPTFVAAKPKKEDPKQKELSVNVRKFLEKRKAEDEAKAREALAKKQKLLELRSHDKKATKRVGQMLRMTKSANKSVIAEANTCLEDSLAEQDGYQPDEDDYGYVSQHAAEYHKKMMEKYRAIPANKPPPKTKHNGVAIPEVQSLKKTTVDGRDKIDSDDGSSPSQQESSKASKEKSAKKKKPPPPALNFNDLLQLAQQKSQEPVIIQKPKVPVMEEKFEFGRPMTAKEKAKYLQEKAIREKINRGEFTGKSTPDKSAQPKAGTSASFKIPNKNQKPMQATAPPKPAEPQKSKTIPVAVASSSKSNGAMPSKAPSSGARSPKTEPSSGSVSSKRRLSNPRLSPPPTPRTTSPVPNTFTQKSMKPRAKETNNHKGPSLPPAPSRRPSLPPAPSRGSSLPHAPISSKDPSRSRDERRSQQQHLHDHKKMKAPPPPKVSYEREPPRRDRYPSMPSTSKTHHHVRSRSPPIQPKLKHRPVIESEDEDDEQEEEEDYDSEMDDFIDDSDLGANQISDMIRSITGYDKRRYKDTSDDECMESSVWDQMREERRSLKIGIMEDQEDIRREEEEKKLKAKMMKSKKKSMR